MRKLLKNLMKNFLSFVVMCFCFGFAVSFANFSDTTEHQYRESIQYLADHGVVGGYPDGTFKPDQDINRAEIMKIMLEASRGGENFAGEYCFPDVKTEWFAKYLCYAKLQ